jgi:glycosyltransferase involved in cell wall biosynthesis
MVAPLSNMRQSLNIVGYFHLAVPEHNAGSETTVFAGLRAMVQRGHRVRIICDRSMQAPYEIDGIEVVRPPRRGQESWIRSYVKDADILTTHLDLTSQAMQLSIDTRKPLVHWVHNDGQLPYWHVTPHKCQLAIFNSQWVADKKVSWEYGQEPCVWQGRNIIIHPVVEPDRYRCERGESITLVNPTPGKGAGTFYALARQMPERHFLAVTGGYGEQIAPPSDLGNITLMDHTPDIREAFRRTKVLLMPSEYESYGRVGIEAACAGIPTIAHPTPGLKEAFGEAGIYLDRNDISAWYGEVERLLTDEVYYRTRSDAVLRLANSLDPESEFDRLEEAMLLTSEAWKNKEKDKMGKMWTSDKRLYFDKDRNITTDASQAVSLACGVGGQIPEADAIKAGLTSAPAERTEPLLDTKMLTESENKMEKPAENKAAKKKSKKAA